MYECGVYLQEDDLKVIQKYVGTLYTSRSELIRFAVREFLIEIIRNLKDRAKNPCSPDPINEENYVQIPIDSYNDQGEPITIYKTFKTKKLIKV